MTVYFSRKGSVLLQRLFLPVSSARWIPVRPASSLFVNQTDTTGGLVVGMVCWTASFSGGYSDWGSSVTSTEKQSFHRRQTFRFIRQL